MVQRLTFNKKGKKEGQYIKKKIERIIERWTRYSNYKFGLQKSTYYKEIDNKSS